MKGLKASLPRLSHPILALLSQPLSLLVMVLACLSIFLLVHANVSSYLLGFLVLTFIFVFILAINKQNELQNNHLKSLSSLFNAIKYEDYNIELAEHADPHIESLVEQANEMARELAQKRRQQKEQTALLEQVIEHIDSALIALDSNGKRVFANQQATEFFELQRGTQVFTTWLNNYVNADSYLSSRAIECVVEHNNKQYHCLLFIDKFTLNKQTHRMFLIKKVDAVFYQQQVSAWQKLVRVISHELNNSLAPVATISRTLATQIKQKKSPQNLVEGLSIISERAEFISRFIHRYQQLSQLPIPSCAPTNMIELVKEVALLYPSVSLTKVESLSVLAQDKIDCFVDSGQVKQVLINLVMNAQQANQMRIEKEPINSEIESLKIELSLFADSQNCVLQIKDSGLGIINPDNLFTPFYSTKPGGSGIGLALSKHIITQHHGQLILTNRVDEHGAIAEITLPLINP